MLPDRWTCACQKPKSGRIGDWSNNRCGLVIELMWLDETRYPAADSRPALDVLEWIQYQLDTAATVNELLAQSEKVRITSLVTLHYLVNDKAGDSATIEFLNGKLVAHQGNALPVSTLTNDTYEKSLNYSKATLVENARGKQRVVLPEAVPRHKTRQLAGINQPLQIGERVHNKQGRLCELRLVQARGSIIQAEILNGISEHGIGHRDLFGKHRKKVRPHSALLRSLSGKYKYPRAHRFTFALLRTRPAARLGAGTACCG